MDNFITKTEHAEFAQRIHERIDAVGNSVVRQEEIVKTMKEQSQQMHDAMFDLEHGFLFKFKSMCTQVGIQWWFISGIAIAIVTIGVRAFAK